MVLRLAYPARSPEEIAPRPEKRPRILSILAFWICYAAISVLAVAIYVRVVPSPDQSIFDYMAWLDLHGVRFYKGSFDMTWPGQLVFHELGVEVFGVHPWTARATDFVLLQPAVLAIYLYLRRCGFPRAAAGASLLYPIIYVTSGTWMTGLRDLTGAHFLIGAAIFALPSKKQVGRQLFWSGTLIGYATMIRPTYLAFAPMLFFLAISDWPGPRPGFLRAAKDAGLFASGLIIAPLVFAIYGLRTDSLHDWYVDSIQFVFRVYFASQPLDRALGRLATVMLKDLWWLTITAIIGSVLWISYNRNRRGLFLLLAMAATFVLSYFVQNKAFVYHLAGIIPVMLILGSAGVEAGLTLPFYTASLRNAFAVLCALVLLSGTAMRVIHARSNSPFWGRDIDEPMLRTPDAIAIATEIQNESTASETFFQWGWNYQVSFLSKRTSPSRLINTPGARAIKPGQPIFGEWLTQFDRELSERPPKFILVDETAIVPGTFKFIPARPGTMLDILERHIENDYAILDQRQNATLLKRRG